jgi:hypothetical protein
MLMLEDKEIRRIISGKEWEEIEVCLVIQRYIFDSKGITIWVKPDYNSPFEETLFFHAMYIAFSHYYLKFNQDEKVKV